MALRADTAIQYLKGIGPARATRLAALGLQTVDDLLHYFPFRYETETGEIDIADLKPGMRATIRGTVMQFRRQRRGSVVARIYDGTEQCTLRWFNQPYMARSLYQGATVLVTGMVQEYNGLPEFVQPQVRVYDQNAKAPAAERGVRQVGVYRGNAEVSSRLVRSAVAAVLREPQLPTEEFLPPDLLQRHDLPPREQALRWMHAPPDDAAAARARRRFVYEELFLLELAMALRRRRLLRAEVGAQLPVSPEIDQRIRARFPFSLTPAQDQVVKEIAADLRSGRPMTRLLQGDVGSGKTVVALYACLAAIAHRRQAALMAPTELLARQHWNKVQQYLAGSRVRTLFLRGGLSAAERAAMLRQVESGEADLVIGTQAIIQKDVAFHDLALVVVDEQHKFGVVQRHAFRTKGPQPHYLVMTATPIPRTLAMTVFGDLDVSIIKQSPPGRGKITTRVVPAEKWATVMEYVRGRLEGGEQAYVVCPRIGEIDEPADEAEQSEPAPKPQPGQRKPAERSSPKMISARQVYDLLYAGPWQGLDIALLHGRLAAEEKQDVVARFSAGKLHAVVSTTVVEVGVDVPNATVMIVENADRFGLSQLHQLRGRVGRGSRDSLCVLISRAPPRRDAPAAERLNVMAETNDGFKIAEADLQQRGPGELFGTRQHGLPELRIANLVTDFELLEKARADAFALVQLDPQLRQPTSRALLPPLKRLFAGRLSLIDAA